MDNQDSIKDIFDYDEEYDKFKTKVLKYVLFKKRTEQEVREKFKDTEGIKDYYIDDVINFLKENKYIDEEDYIRRFFAEYMAIRTYSRKEIEYRMIKKGIKQEDIDKFVSKYDMEDKITEYEINSALKLLNKREDKDANTNINYLLNKGFKYDNIKEAIDRL